MEKRESHPLESEDIEKSLNNGNVIQAKVVSKTEQANGMISSAELSSTKDNHEYITGMKFALVVGAISLCCFLMLLDTSIVVTVSLIYPEFS